MSKKYIRHTVEEMSESLIQKCIICGEELLNFNNNPPITYNEREVDRPLKDIGLSIGNIYVSYPNKDIMCNEEMINNADFILCTPSTLNIHEN